MAASQSWERQLHGSQRFYRSSPRLRLRSRVLALFMELRGQPGNMAVWDRGDSNQTPSPQLRRLLTYSFVCFPLVRMRLNYVMLVHSDMFIGGWPISHGDFGQKWNRSWNVYIDNIALFLSDFFLLFGSHWGRPYTHHCVSSLEAKPGFHSAVWRPEQEESK